MSNIITLTEKICKAKNISVDNIRAIELLYNKEREISAVRMKTTDGFIVICHNVFYVEKSTKVFNNIREAVIYYDNHQFTMKRITQLTGASRSHCFEIMKRKEKQHDEKEDM